MNESKLTHLEQMTIQMEYVVPLIRDLQQVLGEGVVNEALAERARRQLDQARRAPAPQADLAKLGRQLTDYYAAGDALDYEILAAEPDRFDVNVRRCAYTELMDRLSARDIGHLLICSLDFANAAGLGMKLTRTQTCMQGAEFCDFRFRRRE